MCTFIISLFGENLITLITITLKCERNLSTIFFTTYKDFFIYSKSNVKQRMLNCLVMFSGKKSKVGNECITCIPALVLVICNGCRNSAARLSDSSAEYITSYTFTLLLQIIYIYILTTHHIHLHNYKKF
jgi:hypothetical protein